MAQVYRPVYTHTDPVTGKKSKRKGKRWHIRYWTRDGRRVRVKGYSDRQATLALAVKLERREARLAEGIHDPTDEHARKPLAEHAEDFRGYLAAKGNTADYVQLATFRLTAVLDACRFDRIGDVQASAVVNFLGELRAKGRSVKTANDYLVSMKSFCRWLWKDKRTCIDLLAGLAKLPNGETDIRHARRDLSADELAWLLDATRNSRREKYKLAGIDRHFLYLTAAATGFRVSELASMTPESFALEGDTPTGKVRAGCTKNRCLARQPLPVDVTAALRHYLRDKQAGQPVWGSTSWPVHASIMIHRDLDEARRTWLQSFQDGRQRDETARGDFLAYRDSLARVADFHALRHTFITMVGKVGVSPKEHQDLARHSTYALMGRYTHSRFYDLAAAVQALPIRTAGPARKRRHWPPRGPMDAKFPLAQTLARNRLKREISGDKQRHVTMNHHRQKTPENKRFSRAFRGQMK